jgi:hypothetical protein
MDSKAGNREKVKKNATTTPTAATTPKRVMESTPPLAIAAKAPAVVAVVMRHGAVIQRLVAIRADASSAKRDRVPR